LFDKFVLDTALELWNILWPFSKHDLWRGGLMIRKHSVYVAVLCTVLFLISVGSLYAQYTTGTVQGTVFDPSGAVVPNATVKLHNLGTNVTRSFKTGQNGIYSFPAAPPGSYEVTVQAQGFSQAATQFTAVASQTVTEDLKLGMQGSTEQVQVQGEGVAILDKTDAQVSQNYDSIEVNDLPTNHSASGLVSYAPGVQPMYSPRGGSLVKLSGAQTGQISSDGGRPEYSNVELDFTDANDWEFGGFALGTTPDPSFVQEFKVLTADVPADYGIKSNGEIEMITKSGTNNWHGEANDYLQNDYFNARNYNDTTGKPARTDTNNYGIAMGGPVQKDKTWLFGGWRQNRKLYLRRQCSHPGGSCDSDRSRHSEHHPAVLAHTDDFHFQSAGWHISSELLQSRQRLSVPAARRP
jgi:hypothetical protein